MSFMYRENNKEPRTVPWGTPDKTGAQSDFTPFTTTRCFLKQRKESIHFNLLPYSIAKQFAFKDFMRGCIKRLFKIQYECVNLFSVVQDFSPIIYYRSQLSFTTVTRAVKVEESQYMRPSSRQARCTVKPPRPAGNSQTIDKHVQTNKLSLAGVELVSP